LLVTFFREKPFGTSFTQTKLSEMKNTVQCVRSIIWGCCFTLVLLSSTSSYAATWYVKPSGDDANAGTSWAAAFKTLQKALASVASGDQIWVAAGTYYPDEGGGATNDDRGAAFVMRNGVEILGGFPATGSPGLAQRNWTANPTILSGDIGTVGYNDDNSRHVVFNNVNGLNATAILDGFTIADGRADGEGFYDGRGGGMHNRSSSPNIRNCTFLENRAISGCGMYNESASPTVTNCLFSSNSTLVFGTGGGMFNIDGASPMLSNCVFNGNTANTGGGLSNEGCSPTVVNCVFSGNTASLGSGMNNNAASPTVVNCSFSSNSAGAGGGLRNDYNSFPMLSNCIIWGNSDGISNRLNAAPVVTYSIVQGGYSGTGNLNLDPLFVDAASHNFRLQICSPAINAGNNAAVTPGTTTDLGGDPRFFNSGTVDMGAYEYQNTPTPLIAGCQNQTVSLSSAGTGTLAASALNNGSSGCGTLSFTVGGQTSLGVTCSNIGSTQYILTVMDARGKTATCTANVTVEDKIGPSINCKMTEIALGVNNSASITPADVFQSGSDNCGTVQPVSVSPNTFNCSNVNRPNTVLFLATDGHGNSSACSASVIVRDLTPPTVTCKDHTVFLSAAGTASVAPSDVFQSGSDNCGTVNPASVLPNTFNCAHVGPQTVTLTANDGNGNSVTCTATVTVRDNIPPSVFCKSATLDLGANGTATLSLYSVFSSATDNCGPATPISVYPESFDCSHIGPQTVYLLAQDNNGNSAQCSASVIVRDATPPALICKNVTVTLSASGTGTISASDVFQSGSDNCNTVNPPFLSSSSFNCTHIGQNTVHVTASDASGNQGECLSTVTVRDITPPTVTCKSYTAILSAAGTASITPANVFQSGSDNCGTVNLVSVVPNAFDCTQIGPVTTALTVNDGHGNTTTCTASVTVQDNTPPTITCPANIVRGTDANQCTAVVFYANPTVSDNCSNGVLTRTGGLASNAAFPPGINMVQWKVTDPGNNTAICQFTVTVVDAEPPVFSCPANVARSTDPGQCSATVSYATPIATDNCGVASVILQSGANTASGSTFAKGVTTVVWKATDTATPTSNTATCSFTVTVNDTELPNLSCPLSQTIGSTPMLCTGVATFATPAGSDNCPLPPGAVTQTSGPASGSAFPKGATTVVFKVTDGAGLTKTCTFKITVNDTENPVVVCPSSQSKSADAGLCTAIASYTTPTATDNCMPAPTLVRVSGPASGSAFQMGTTTCVWRAVDGAMRSSTCSFTVTVMDTQLPGISCPANQSVTAAAGECSATFYYSNPTATDNCGVISVYLLSGLASGSLFPQGATVNTWRAVDQNGLSQTCSFSVMVACGTGAQGGESERRSDATFEKSRNLSNLDLRVSPNPAVAEVQISVENLGDAGGELVVYDAQGRLMWRRQAGDAFPSSHPLTVSLLDFPAGVYFVALRARGYVVTKRLVVNQM